MHDQSSLSLQLEPCDKQRQSGRSIGALDRNSQKSGRLVEDDHGIIFVKHGKLTGETRPALIFESQNLTDLLLRLRAWRGSFFIGGVPDDQIIIMPFP